MSLGRESRAGAELMPMMDKAGVFLPPRHVLPSFICASHLLHPHKQART